MLSSEDIAACRALLRGGSRTFHAASRLLPARVRTPAAALYAFCRLADDAIDSSDDPAATLAVLHARLDAAYAGRPGPVAADRALASVLHAYAIPRALPEALLEGFAWDAEGRRYADIASLRAYGMRVAGTVGAMMTLLMGVRDPDALARACDLGVAMQLTNIARDVGEDARAGRLYLPRDWLDEAGIDADAFLARPAHSAALATVIGRLLDEADRLYARGAAGIACLPRQCRPAIGAARLLYAEIGREVERQGLDSVTARAVVSGRRKVAVLRRLPALLVHAPQADAPPLNEARFLIAAVEPAQAAEATIAWWDLGGRIVWAMDLFEQLERRKAQSPGWRAARAEAGNA